LRRGEESRIQGGVDTVEHGESGYDRRGEQEGESVKE